MNLSYVGYTYFIKFLVTGQVYYGSRCDKEFEPGGFSVHTRALAKKGILIS
jgi:hypothetical protein